MVKLEIRRNFCRCHPETCGCKPYKIVIVDGKTETQLTTAYDQGHGQTIIDLINQHFTPKS